MAGLTVLGLLVGTRGAGSALAPNFYDVECKTIFLYANRSIIFMKLTCLLVKGGPPANVCIQLRSARMTPFCSYDLDIDHDRRS